MACWIPGVAADAAGRIGMMRDGGLLTSSSSLFFTYLFTYHTSLVLLLMQQGLRLLVWTSVKCRASVRLSRDSSPFVAYNNENNV